mgnify:CR=1 FL=1
MPIQFNRRPDAGQQAKPDARDSAVVRPPGFVTMMSAAATAILTRVVTLRRRNGVPSSIDLLRFAFDLLHVGLRLLRGFAESDRACAMVRESQRELLSDLEDLARETIEATRTTTRLDDATTTKTR